jgi:hypothetical protein
MNREELEILADYLETRLREIGEVEIADQRHYTLLEHETGDEFLVDPRKRIMLMLDGLERSVQLLDRKTYLNARKSLAQNVEGMGDIDIEIRRIDDRESERPSFRFYALPDRNEQRSAISAFIQRLAADSDGPL